MAFTPVRKGTQIEEVRLVMAKLSTVLLAKVSLLEEPAPELIVDAI